MFFTVVARIKINDELASSSLAVIRIVILDVLIVRCTVVIVVMLLLLLVMMMLNSLWLSLLVNLILLLLVMRTDVMNVRMNGEANCTGDRWCSPGVHDHRTAARTDRMIPIHPGDLERILFCKKRQSSLNIVSRRRKK